MRFCTRTKLLCQLKLYLISLTSASARMDYLYALFDYWFSIAVASAILLLLYLWGVAPYRTLDSHYKNVPGPRAKPFVGHLFDTIRHKMQIHLQLHEYYMKYGELYKMYFFGKIPCLVVSDPEMLKDIFVKEFDSFSDRPSLIKVPEPLRSMLTSAEKEKWKRIRNTLTPAFSAHKMKQMVPLMNTCCDTLLRKLGKIAGKEESIDIIKIQQGLTMDVILSAAFGIQANCQENPEDRVFLAGLQALTRSSLQRLLITLIVMLPFGLKIMEKFPSLWLSNFLPIMNVAEEMIRTKRTSDGETARKDMLDLMLAASDDPSVPEAKKLSDMEVVAQSIVFLVAGYETTSTSLSLVCHHLATNPEVQDKVQQEIDSVWTDEDNMLSYETLHEMPYLEMVISETLRLYPPGFIVARVCTKDCCIKGLNLTKGAIVIVPAYSIHHDPAIYPDPERFDPERFSAEAKASRNPYRYLPFGHGPHNCIGLRFAQMEMKFVLARILKKFRLHVAPDTKIPPVIQIKSTLSCSDVKLRVTPRAKVSDPVLT